MSRTDSIRAHPAGRGRRKIAEAVARVRARKITSITSTVTLLGGPADKLVRFEADADERRRLLWDGCSVSDLIKVVAR